MKVLILEDSHARIQTFKNNLKGHDLYFYDQVDDAKQAFDLLGPWDAIFIDHDLDDKVYVNSKEENTGYQFAKYISDKELPDMIVCHSMNPAGALNIKAAIPKCQIVPFPNLFN